MKKIRGLTSFLLVAVLLLSTVFNGSLAFAADNITVEIDGQRVNFSDQQPVIKDGKTLVPVRGVFEKLGYSVSWEQSTQTATLSNGVNTVIITVGKSSFTTNGNTYSLDVPAQIINGKTMLPFRAVLESVGCSVDWNGGSNTVIVSSGNSNNGMTEEERKHKEQLNALIEIELEKIRLALPDSSKLDGISGYAALTQAVTDIQTIIAEYSNNYYKTIPNDLKYNGSSEFVKYCSDYFDYYIQIGNTVKSVNLSSSAFAGAMTMVLEYSTAKTMYENNLK